MSGIPDKILDTSKVFIDVKTLAGLKGVTERAVRLAIRQNKYIAKTAGRLSVKYHPVLVNVS